MEYLQNRKQSVCFKNCVSRKINALSGVPQGSHLGPVLFVLFINDLPDVIQKSEILLYADDAKVFQSFNSISNCCDLQEDFNNLLNWCNNNDLTVNTNKCNILSFNRRRMLTKFDYNLDGNVIERVNNLCDLGVIFDEKLNFNNHIDSIVSRAYCVLGMIKRWTKEFNDPHIAKCLYTSLVRSILEYGSPVWSPFYACHVNRLESVQRQFLLFALSTLNWENRLALPKYEHRLLLLDLNTLSDRRIISNVMFMCKLLNGNINYSVLLNYINVKCPLRQSRFYNFLSLSNSKVNYIQNEAFNSICKNFNEYYFIFDFNLSIELIKCNLAKYLKFKMKN